MANKADPGTYSWGGDVRARNEYFNNALTLNDTAVIHEQDYFRTRIRLWFAATIAPDTLFNVRLAAEPRVWMKPSYAKQHPGLATETRYALIDNLNLKWNGTAGGNPVTVTVGRQELMFGDTGAWWLVADATPSDGSWTAATDAVRLSIDLKQSKTRVDLVFLDQNARPGQRLPIIGSRCTYSLAEQNEQGVILYASNKSVPDTQLDGYFIYKSDRKFYFSNGENADIYTLGSKASGNLDANWKYSIEGAVQWGSSQDPTVKTPVAATQRRDIQAFGGNGKISYLLKDAHNNQLSLVAEYLSGDKPGTTNKDEMFDILWGRYPRYSEISVFSFANETSGKVCQLNNVLRFGPQWSFTPTASSSFSATYNFLFAPQSTPTRAMKPELFSKNGSHDRGGLLQLVYRQKFTKQLSGLLWAEYMKQGDYYASHALESFYRVELAYTF